MITRRKLFGLLAGLPFVKALPAASLPISGTPIEIGELWAGVDIACDADYSPVWHNLDCSKTITISGHWVSGETSYRYVLPEDFQ